MLLTPARFNRQATLDLRGKAQPGARTLAKSDSGLNPAENGVSTMELFAPAAFAMEQAPRLLHKLRVVRETTADYGNCQVLDKLVQQSGDVYHLFKKYCNALDREEFQVLAMNTKNRVCGWTTISVGTLNSAIVHPRDVFKFALLANASAITFIHNHPSGNPSPSDEDILLTSRLVDAGKLLGIQVLDHVICGEYEWYSFADHGRMK